MVRKYHFDDSGHRTPPLLCCSWAQCQITSNIPIVCLPINAARNVFPRFALPTYASGKQCRLCRVQETPGSIILAHWQPGASTTGARSRLLDISFSATVAATSVTPGFHPHLPGFTAGRHGGVTILTFAGSTHFPTIPRSASRCACPSKSARADRLNPGTAALSSTPEPVFCASV